MLKSATQEKLSEWARMNNGCDEGRVPFDEIEWAYVSEFPLGNLTSIMSADEWVAWFNDELQMLTDDFGDARRWSCLLDEEIEEPCVILIHEDEQIEIWDGWHRSAASFVKGAPSLKAVVGRACNPTSKPKI